MDMNDIISTAKKLISQMTLEEKVLQTMHSSAAIDRLGIKSYNWWNEALHGVARAGVATVFPQAIALAATFDEDTVYAVADIVSTEARAKYNMQQKHGDHDIYKGLTMWSPNVNIFRDPRWGRGHETFGEDPYLTSRMGVRFIQGLQGGNERYLKTAACAKHFAVHSGPEDERHSFDAVVSEQDLRETYLPAFKACVQQAKVEAVMGAYNRVNGEPCCGSKTLLKDILRGEWGFKGHVVSDCWAIKDFHMHHKVTETPEQSVALAMNNGCDLNCGNMFIYLQKAIEDGLLDEEALDESLVRLYSAKIKLGIIGDDSDNPYREIGYEKVDCQEHRDFNLEVAKKSVVLLKNENKILPLDQTKIKTIGVIGPNANNRKALVGNYEGTASRYYTILEGIQEYVGDDVRVMHSEGCHLYKGQVSGLGQKNDRISEVKEICSMSDVVVACLGLDADLEGEEGDVGNEYASGDKPNLNLPGIQEDMLKTIVESGKPTILVMLSGSALAIKWADENVPAILQGWYPGAQGGKAIASVLFGDFSPEGKLPVTFYKTDEELPDIHEYSMENRTYRYMKNDALYPFGYGLSYTSFTLEDVECSAHTIQKDEAIQISLKIKNTGDFYGGETIQVYIERMADNAPNPQLKYLKKVHLEKEETALVDLCIPADAFGLYGEDGKKAVQPGKYSVYVGTSQPDSRSLQLTENKVYQFSLTAEEEIQLGE